MDDELRGLLARYARGELSADDARRAILRYPKWRVAEIDGELETVALDDGTPMLIAESSASDGREYSGLELVRDIAPLVGGLSFDPDEPWGSAFRPGALPELQNWARTVELEDAVAKPGPGQRDLLYEGPWWVAVSPGTGRPAVHRADGLDVITIMTAPDAAATFRRTERHRGLDVVRLGPALWGDLARRQRRPVGEDHQRLWDIVANKMKVCQIWPPWTHVSPTRGWGCGLQDPSQESRCPMYNTPTTRRIEVTARSVEDRFDLRHRSVAVSGPAGSVLPPNQLWRSGFGKRPEPVAFPGPRPQLHTADTTKPAAATGSSERK